MDYRKIKDAAKQRGLNAEWLPETQQVEMPQVPLPQTSQVPAPTALRPEAQAMLQAIGQHQEATQPYVPFPAGTPTLQTQQFREGQRQFDERMAFEKEQYAEALRQAAMKGAGGVSPEAQQMNVLDQLRAITEQAVNAGKSFDVVSDFIQMNAPYFGGIGKTDDIEDIAKTMYRTALGSYDPYTRYEASGRPYISSGSEIRKYQDLLGSTQAQIEPEGEWEHVSGNTYRNRLTGELVIYDPTYRTFIPVGGWPEQEGAQQTGPNINWPKTGR